MYRTSLFSVVLTAVVVGFTACAPSQPSSARAPRPMMESGEMGPSMTGHPGMSDSCPLGVAGTTVQAEGTKDGMAMTFSTTGDLADLRRRVRAMADRMNARASEPASTAGMHGPMMGADAGMGMGGMGMMGGSMRAARMPPVHAEKDDVEGGARMTMIPVDPSNLQAMRQHMMERARTMNTSHGCSTMAAAGE